jgi:DNA-binding IclR family transcriptional regulator
MLRQLKPGITNRSLLRGIEILRAFRPGSYLLGNSDIAERTGLAKSTVSRLTQTLVSVGMLELDSEQRAYRLAPATLSFAHSMRTGSQVLQLIAPKMRAVAESQGINVGLAAPDRDEMVYLESIRYKRKVAFRNVVSGQRVPMELTSLGRAYLSTLSLKERKPLYTIFCQRRTLLWHKSLLNEIEQSIDDVQALGYCAASWQPGVVAVAAPLSINGSTYVLNTSLTTNENFSDITKKLSIPLKKLLREVSEASEK